MKKLQLQPKLSLNTESIHVLTDQQLQDAAGGATKTNKQFGFCSLDGDTNYTAYANCTADSYAATACTGC